MSDIYLTSMDFSFHNVSIIIVVDIIIDYFILIRLVHLIVLDFDEHWLPGKYFRKSFFLSFLLLRHYLDYFPMIPKKEGEG